MNIRPETEKDKTTIPDDNLGRSWVQANLEDDFRRKLSSGIVVFIGFGPNRKAQLAGTGFVIGTNKRDGIVITAKHVLTEGIVLAQKPNRKSHASTLDQFIPKSAKQPIVNKERIRAIWMGESAADMCIVHSVQFNDQLDIATCLISRQDDSKDNSHINPFALDTSIPQPGNKIALISSSALDLKEISINKNLENQLLSISKNIVVRMGVVTSVNPTGHRQHQFPSFETTIPVEPGMSGGLVYQPIENELIAACGVISTDFSDETSFSNFFTSGNSLMSMIWPSVGMSIPATVPPIRDGPNRTIFDFIRAGEIQNLARDGVKLSIQDTGNGNYSVKRCV